MTDQPDITPRDSFLWPALILLAALILAMAINYRVSTDLDATRADLAQCRVDLDLQP